MNQPHDRYIDTLVVVHPITKQLVPFWQVDWDTEEEEYYLDIDDKDYYTDLEFVPAKWDCLTNAIVPFRVVNEYQEPTFEVNDVVILLNSYTDTAERKVIKAIKHVTPRVKILRGELLSKDTQANIINFDKQEVYEVHSWLNKYVLDDDTEVFEYQLKRLIN